MICEREIVIGAADGLKVHSENVVPQLSVYNGGSQKRSKAEDGFPDPPAKRVALDSTNSQPLSLQSNGIQRVLISKNANGTSENLPDTEVSVEDSVETAQPHSDPSVKQHLASNDTGDKKVNRKTPKTNVMVSLDILCPLDYYIPKDDLPPGVVDIDLHLVEDFSCDPHYAHESIRYLREREKLFLVQPFPENENEVSSSTRAILVDWLIELQMDYQLNHEALYLSVKTVDRYLSLKSVPRDKLQLLAVAAMLISCKLDKRNSVPISKIVHSCDHMYSKTQIFGMEREILKTLDFDFSVPLSYTFLRRFCRCFNMNLHEMTLARFILECSLLDYTMVGLRESHLAAAALLLAADVLGKEWNDTLTYYTGYIPRELIWTRDRMHRLVVHFKKTYEKNNLKVKAVLDKYSDEAFFSVADLSFPPINV